jgi:hypothetical protein
MAPQETRNEVEEPGPSRRRVRIELQEPDGGLAVGAINPQWRRIMQRDVRNDDEGRLLRVLQQFVQFHDAE